MKKKKIVIMAIIIFVVMVLSLMIARFYNVFSGNGKTIKVSGNIEGDDVRISFRVGGQIEELLVDEGYVLMRGQLVARLNTDELSRKKNEAQASLKAAEYQLSLDDVNYVRAENLFGAGAISAQQRDTAKTKADASRAKVEELKATLELTETQLGFAELASPLNGYVLVKSALAGEVVQSGAPVFTAVDLNNIWVTGYINENELGKVKLNQKAYGKTDTYPGKKYDGWVSFISQQAEFTPKYIQTTTERVKLVYRVKVRMDNTSLDLKPGMPIDAYITIDNKTE
ncbi:MAG: efflux RND transporter periplasmic adaptor subunit [Candidatus Omnitrophica bacterium]|nr:efflux RND transporter periplasmic adaptor subunit [Candidatus Omnitrophota bacterium]